VTLTSEWCVAPCLSLLCHHRSFTCSVRKQQQPWCVGSKCSRVKQARKRKPAATVHSSDSSRPTCVLVSRSRSLSLSSNHLCAEAGTRRMYGDHVKRPAAMSRARTRTRAICRLHTLPTLLQATYARCRRPENRGAASRVRPIQAEARDKHAGLFCTSAIVCVIIDANTWSINQYTHNVSENAFVQASH